MARRDEILYMENELILRIPADAHTFEGFERWLYSDDFPETGRIDFLGGEIYVDTGWDNEMLVIPEDAHSFEGFWRWVESDEFPKSGRIDFLDGEIEADLRPEDQDSHGAIKVEIVRTLGSLANDTGLGDLKPARSRFRSSLARVITEPDVVGTFEGTVKLIVEIVSDGSADKDLTRLPPFYARAGVRELWLLDARGAEIRFDILTLQEGAYVTVPPDEDGWLRSLCLERAFRLQRFHQPPFPWSYRLEHRSI